MQASVEEQLREILEAFREFGLRTVDDISELVTSVNIYVEVLKLLIPEYEEFYRELISDSESTLQEKLQAIVHFLESEIIDQQIDIQTHLIAQGDYTEALQLLDVLYSLLEGLLEAEKEQQHKKKTKKQQKSSKKPAEASRNGAVTNEEPRKQQKPKLIERPTQNNQQKPKRQQSASAKAKPKEASQKQMPDITSAVINEIKQARKSVSKSKTNMNFHDKDSTQAVLRAGRQYQHHLKDHLHQRKALSKQPTEDLIKKNLRHTLNRIGKEASESESKIKAEQLRCFIELRDQKLRYVQRIHKLILQLEKQKHLDQKQQSKKIMEEQLKQAKYKMETLDNAYRDKMNMIRETMKETRLKNQDERLKQKEIVTELSKQLKQQRDSQYQNMMTEWQKEQDRLRMIFRTDEKLEKALISLYKKN